MGGRGVAIALVGVGLAGCGGSAHGGQRNVEPSGARLVPPVRLADCDDWNRAAPQTRVRLVQALRRFATGPVGSPVGRGAGLDDREAYRLFENYCRNDFAGKFRLYRLYNRAAAFSRQ